MSKHDQEGDDEIVQLGCNPAHVFHAECIEDFVFCPECFVPIEEGVSRGSFMDERSVGPPQSDGEEDDHLIADNEQQRV